MVVKMLKIKILLVCKNLNVVLFKVNYYDVFSTYFRIYVNWEFLLNLVQ